MPQPWDGASKILACAKFHNTMIFNEFLITLFIFLPDCGEKIRFISHPLLGQMLFWDGGYDRVIWAWEQGCFATEQTGLEATQLEPLHKIEKPPLTAK